MSSPRNSDAARAVENRPRQNEPTAGTPCSHNSSEICGLALWEGGGSGEPNEPTRWPAIASARRALRKKGWNCRETCRGLLGYRGEAISTSLLSCDWQHIRVR